MKGIGLLPVILLGVFITFTGLIIAEGITIVGILNTTENITQVMGVRWLNTTETLYINASYPSLINTSINCTQIFGADADFCVDTSGGLVSENITVKNIFGNETNYLNLQANETLTNSYMKLHSGKQEFGSDIIEVQFNAIEVNFTDIIGRKTLQFNASGVNIMTNLNLRKSNFEYPAGGYKLIDHTPTVYNISEDFPNLLLADFSPTWIYNESLNMGFGITSAMVFRPEFRADGIPTGLDLATSSGSLFAPTISDPSGNRTFLQLIGFIAQPRLRTHANVSIVTGVSGTLSVADNSTIGTYTAFGIADPTINDTGSITTIIGLKIAELTKATNNYAIQSDGGNSYHIGRMVLNTSCTDPDHALVIGGTGAGCNTGTYSEIDAGESTFTISSSELIKENFKDVTEPNILTKVADTPIYTYDFKGYTYYTEEMNMTTGKTYNVAHNIPPATDKMGFKAEEFYTIFGRGTNSTIKGDEIMMAMWLSIQELIKENALLKARVSALE